MSLTNYEDIVINQGTDVTIEVHLVHDSGSSLNLANRTVSAMMKRRYTDSANDPDSLQFTTAITSPAADGVLTLSLTNAQTDTLNPRGRYVYDVELSHLDSDSNTITQRVLEGHIEVSPSVTK